MGDALVVEASRWGELVSDTTSLLRLVLSLASLQLPNAAHASMPIYMCLIHVVLVCRVVELEL